MYNNINYMNYIKITNSKETKTKTGISFQVDSSFFYLSYKVLQQFKITINNATDDKVLILKENTIIESNNNWFFINKDNIKYFINKTKELNKFKKELNDDNSIFKEWKKNNIQEDVAEYNTTVKEYYKINDSFNTFIKNNTYKDGGLNKSFIVIKNNLDIHNNIYEPEICAIQNFINKSINSHFINKINISTLIISTILECFKTQTNPNETLFISYYKNYEIKINNTLEELKQSLFLYQEIFKTKDIYIKINLFLKNIEFKEIKTKEMIFKTKTKIIISFKETIALSFLPSFISKSKIEYVILKKDVIDKMVQYIFKEQQIDKLKYEQFNAIKKIINDKTNILAVLKTGFGKSLIYQLFSFLQPNIIIAIFPINALILDQSFILSKKNNFEFTMSNQDIKNNNNIINAKTISHKRLFLITAERLENVDVNHTLSNLSNFIGTIVFDEAHCISEWGHDFRPSYLVARHMMENIKNKNKELKIIALTATAAPYIQKDIMKILNIFYNGLINIADTSGLYRKELKYKLIKKDDHGFLKRKDQKSIWKDIALEVSKKSTTYKGLSIIYFIYASSGSWNNIASAEYAFKTLEFKNSGLYIGSKKEYYNNNKELLILEDFSSIHDLKTIFATKSFGMGINIENCNYVALIQPPSSLEDLYQQSGRAGRKGQDSLVEIFYSNIHLKDPMLKSSPFYYFLKIQDKRKELQPKIVKSIIDIIKDNDFKNIIININELRKFIKQDKYLKDFQNYVKWAIAHLINEFNLISYYTVIYKGFSISHINIYLNKKVTSIKYIDDNINKTIKKYSLETQNESIESNINIFYKYYFEEISKQKKAGINIFVNELKKIDNQIDIDSNKIINNSLNNYYKTKNESNYSFVDKYFSLMKNKKELNILINALKQEINYQDITDLKEVIARHSINIEYTMLTSIIMWLEFNIDPIIDSIENILSYNYEKNYIIYLIDLIVKRYINVWNKKKIILDKHLYQKERYKEVISYIWKLKILKE